MYVHCNITARLRDVYVSSTIPTPRYSFTRDRFYVYLRLPATTSFLCWFKVAGNNQTYSVLHIKCSILLPNSNKVWISHTDFRNYPASNLMDVDRYSRSSADMQTDGEAVRQEADRPLSRHISNIQVQASTVFTFFKLSTRKHKSPGSHPLLVSNYCYISLDVLLV